MGAIVPVHWGADATILLARGRRRWLVAHEVLHLVVIRNVNRLVHLSLLWTVFKVVWRHHTSSHHDVAVSFGLSAVGSLPVIVIGDHINCIVLVIVYYLFGVCVIGLVPIVKVLTVFRRCNTFSCSREAAAFPLVTFIRRCVSLWVHLYLLVEV